MEQTSPQSSNYCLRASINFFLIQCSLSYCSNSSRYCCEQFLPMGDTLSIPVRNSIKVPLLIGISMPARYFKQKLINFCNFSSPMKPLMFFIMKIYYFLSNYLLTLKSQQSIFTKEKFTHLLSLLCELLTDFFIITSSHVSNINNGSNPVQTIEHVLLYFLYQYLGYIAWFCEGSIDIKQAYYLLLCFHLNFNILKYTIQIQNSYYLFKLSSMADQFNNNYKEPQLPETEFCPMSNPDLKIQPHQDFYKLHYPSPKHTQRTHRKQKVRSKSVVSMLQSSVSDELPSYQLIKPKGSMRKQIANRSQLYENRWESSKEIKLTFRQILNPENARKSIQKESLNNLPIKSLRDIQQLAKRNQIIKQALNKSRDQKIKLNRIVLSHKQSQEIKLEYLHTKKQEIQMEKRNEIRGIYDQYFRKQYELMYGAQAQEKFEAKIQSLLEALSKNIFIH